MKVLIGCECSGIVRDAFRALGHDSWSCDLKPCEGDPQWHLVGDVLGYIDRKHANGSPYWDIIGLHPDCTKMAVSGNRWYGSETSNAPRGSRGAWWRQEQHATDTHAYRVPRPVVADCWYGQRRVEAFRKAGYMTTCCKECGCYNGTHRWDCSKRGLSESPLTPCSARRWDRAQLNAAADAACRALGLDPAEHYDLWTDVRWALVKHDAEKSRQNTKSEALT